MRFLLSFVLILNFAITLFAQTHANYTDAFRTQFEKANYVGALKLAQAESEQSYRKKKYEEYTAAVIHQASVYIALNDNPKAFEVLFSALRHIEKLRLTDSQQVLLLREIGGIHLNLKNYNQAKTYYFRAVKHAEKAKSDSLVNVIRQPLYKIYFDTRHDSAFYYLSQIMAYDKKINSAEALSKSHNNFFSYYITTDDKKNARLHIDSAMYYARKARLPAQIGTILINKAAYAIIANKDYPKAKKYYDELFTIQKDSTSADMGESYETYADILIHLGQPEKATEYLFKAIDIRAASYLGTKNQVMRNLEKKYQIDKIHDVYSRKQQELQAAQDRNQRLFLIMIAVFVLTLILFYFFYQNNRLKQQSKLQAIESKVQQNLLIATIEGQETERKKIASVLHDNISAMLSSAGLQLSAFVARNQPAPEEIKKTRDILRVAHDQVRDLSHELMPTLLAKFGLNYALRDLFEKNSNSTIAFKFVGPESAKIRYDEDFEMKIYFILTELCNNIIKHSQASHARLQIEETNKILEVKLSDNGKGIDLNRQNEGFGLTQIKARIASMNGTIEISSPKNAGTLITFQVPVPG